MCTVKNVIECIARPLTHICNQSLQTGVFPNNMKTAKVIPIHIVQRLSPQIKGNCALFERNMKLLP